MCVPAHLYFFQHQVPSQLIYCVILYITTHHNSDRTQHVFILLPHYFFQKVNTIWSEECLAQHLSICLFSHCLRQNTTCQLWLCYNYLITQEDKTSKTKYQLTFKVRQYQEPAQRLFSKADIRNNASGSSHLFIKGPSTMQSGKTTIADRGILQPALAAVRLNIGMVVE